tara:strand:+ start:856 stop:1437 length:582 start_codon:yes stop_codon:yes gene_type:complete
MGLPKQHAIDAPIELISWQDDAWDHERINREDRLLVDDPHPYALYQYGASRFDLSTVREWLLPDAEPAIFTLRRLTLEESATVAAQERRGGIETAWASVWRLGLTAVSGLPLKLTQGLKHGLTEEDKDKIEACIGHPTCLEIGKAVIAASAPLLESEKKRFGSLHGGICQTLATLTAESQPPTAEPTVPETES